MNILKIRQFDTYKIAFFVRNQGHWVSFFHSIQQNRLEELDTINLQRDRKKCCVLNENYTGTILKALLGLFAWLVGWQLNIGSSQKNRRSIHQLHEKFVLA